MPGLLGAAFVAALLVGLLLHLGTRPLELEEPRRALVALELGLRGELVVPTTNGVPYLRKPPLFSWVLLGLMRLTGSASEAILRLPTVASFLIIGLLLLVVAGRRLGREAGLRSAAVFLTFGNLLFYGTLHADIDLFLTLVVLLQALAVFALEQQERPLALFTASYLLAALAFLTKGFPALAFQALTLAGWLTARRRWRWLFSARHLAGLGVFSLVAGGYLALYARTADVGAYVVRMLLDSGERTPASGRYGAGAALLHLATFPLELVDVALPWSLFAGFLLHPAARARIRAQPLLRFCVVFLAVNLVPYWLSPGTRPRYLFPFLPFAAVLLAAGMEAALGEAGAGSAPGLAPRSYASALRRTLMVVLALGALAPLALPLFPTLWRHADGPVAWYLCAAALLAAAVAAWRAPDLRGAVTAAFLALALARVQYDLVVPEYRRATSDDTFNRRVAEELARDFPGQRIRLAGHDRIERLRVPLLGELTLVDREHFTNSLSYYLALGRGELLRYADAVAPGELLLVHPGFQPDRPFEVVRAYDWEGEQHDLQLLRLLP